MVLRESRVRVAPRVIRASRAQLEPLAPVDLLVPRARLVQPGPQELPDRRGPLV